MARNKVQEALERWNALPPETRSLIEMAVQKPRKEIPVRGNESILLEHFISTDSPEIVRLNPDSFELYAWAMIYGKGSRDEPGAV